MKSVDHQTLVNAISEKLKGSLVPPNWASYVKTGHGKQRPPVNPDWWSVRSAAILLSVQKLGPVGVSKLSVKYGNRKNRGMQPEKFATASRNIIRKILQQLESLGYIKQEAKDVHKGRVLTQEGLKLVNDCSKEAKTIQKPVKSVKAESSAVEKPQGNQGKDQKVREKKDKKE